MVTVDPHLHRHRSLDGLYTIPTTIARVGARDRAAGSRPRSQHPYSVGPDAESVQWVSAVADALRRAVRDPREDAARRSRRLGLAPPRGAWNGHTPVVIDDIVSTGKTMIEATRQLRAAGSAAPMCVAIHAVFADSVLDELSSAGAAGIVTCDTIAHASNRICVVDPLAEAAKRYLSLTELASASADALRRRVLVRRARPVSP